MSEFFPTSNEDIEQHINYGEGLKRKYSYDEIHNLIRKGYSKLSNTLYEPDYIISISGGGLIPARILRSYIDVPIINITVSSYNANSQQPTHEPTIIQNIDSSIIQNKSVLIVDEVDDTRGTLKKVVNEIKNTVEEIGIFVVHNKIKEKLTTFPKEILYISCEETQGNIWIEYPWDLI